AMKYYVLIPFSLPLSEELIANLADSVTIKKRKE
ncbi:transcriptional regulator, partial [Niallia circulans]